MANQNDIDTASEQIALLVEKARADLASKLFLIGTNIKNVDSFVEALLAMDIEGTLKSKLVKATQLYANAHRGVLQTTTMFSEPNANALVSFAKLNEELFDSAITKVISGQIKTQVAQGLQLGLNSNQIVEGLIDAGISKHQIETLINTSLNTYSRMVTEQMMKTAPKNTLYNYIGPADGKTRDFCLNMISEGRITKAEILKIRGGQESLRCGGGYNCRHKWDKAPVEQSAFHEVNEAEEQIEKRKANA